MTDDFIERPTILLVGSPDPFHEALVASVESHGYYVETAEAADAMRTALVAAPDLVILTGAAAADTSGSSLLHQIGNNAATATLPVALLSDDAALGARMKALHAGALAVISRSASVHDMAAQIEQLAMGVTQSEPGTGQQLGEASLDELVAMFSQEVRNGILSVSAGDGAQARFVLREGRSVKNAIEGFLKELQPHLSATQSPIKYEFEASPKERLNLLDDAMFDSPGDAALERSARSVLRGRRIMLIERNPAHADAVAQELRNDGAQVVVTDGQGVGLDRALGLDPELAIVEEKGLSTWAYPVVQRLRKHPRLRWVSLLVVPWAEFWPAGAVTPNMDRLAKAARKLLAPDAELAERAQIEESFDTRLEIAGPSRMLRALAQTPTPVHITVRGAELVVELDVAEGLVVGAEAVRVGQDTRYEGLSAIAGLLLMGSGRVRVQRKTHPATANVMSPVADALRSAADERAPIRPSIAAPALPPKMSDMSIRSSIPAGGPAPVVHVPPPAALPDPLDEALTMPRGAARVAAVGTADSVAGTMPAPPREAAASQPDGPMFIPGLGSEVDAPADLAEEDTRNVPMDMVPGYVPPAAPIPAEARAGAAMRDVGVELPTSPAPERILEDPTSQSSDDAKAILGPSFGEQIHARWEALNAYLETQSWFTALPRAAWLGAGVGALLVLVVIAWPKGAPDAEDPGALAAQTAVPPMAKQAPAVANAQDAPAPSGETQAKHEAPPEAAAAADIEAPSEADTPSPTDVAPDAVDGEEAGGSAEGEGAEEASSEEGEGDADGDEAGEEEGDEPEEVVEAGEDDDAAAAKAEQFKELLASADRFRRGRRHAAAQRAYREALAINPASVRAMTGLVRAHLSARQPSEAVAWAKRLTKRRARSPGAHVLLGDALKAAGDRSGATRAYRDALIISPRHSRARQKLREMRGR